MLGKLGKKSSYMFLLTGTTFYHSYKEIREKQLVCQLGARNSTEALHPLRQGECAEQPALPRASCPREGQKPLSPLTALVWVLVLWTERTNSVRGWWYLHLSWPKALAQSALFRKRHWRLPRQLLPQSGMNWWNGMKYLKFWQAVNIA